MDLSFLAFIFLKLWPEARYRNDAYTIASCIGKWGLGTQLTDHHQALFQSIHMNHYADAARRHIPSLSFDSYYNKKC